MEQTKRIKRALARYGLFMSTWLFNHLPYGAVKALTSAFINIGYQLTARQKQISRESLQIAFGQQKNKQEIEQITRSCFENLGKGMIELIYFMGHPPMIKEHVTIDGREHLDRALEKGCGVIAVSAHFGNFPLML